MLRVGGGSLAVVAAVTHSCGGNRRESVCCWMWRRGLILPGILMVGVWNVRQLVAVPGSDLVLPTAGLLGSRRCTPPGVKPDRGARSLHQRTHSPVWVLMGNDGAFTTVWNHFIMGCPWCRPKKFHPGSAKIVSAIIRLPACMSCPGGPLWCRFNNENTQKRCYAVVQRSRFSLLFYVDWNARSKCNTFQHISSSEDMQGHFFRH